MAAEYTPRTWSCGDKITADALNHIEQGIANAGGDCDCGFECEETKSLIINETVTTALDNGYYVADIVHAFQDDPPLTMLITFDGVEYECEKASENGYYYGGLGTNGPDFSKYPFLIVADANGITLYTEAAGTHTLKLESFERTVTKTSGCFVAAVRAALGPLILQQEDATTDPNDPQMRITTPYGEIRDAYLAGRAVILDPAQTKSYYSMIKLVVGGSSSTITFADESVWIAYSDDDYPKTSTNS